MCSDIGTTSRACAMYSFTGMLFTVSFMEICGGPCFGGVGFAVAGGVWAEGVSFVAAHWLCLALGLIYFCHIACHFSLYSVLHWY